MRLSYRNVINGHYMYVYVDYVLSNIIILFKYKAFVFVMYVM